MAIQNCTFINFKCTPTGKKQPRNASLSQRICRGNRNKSRVSKLLGNILNSCHAKSTGEQTDLTPGEGCSNTKIFFDWTGTCWRVRKCFQSVPINKCQNAFGVLLWSYDLINRNSFVDELHYLTPVWPKS